MGLTASIFDTLNKGSAVTLSGSNLIATVSSGTGAVRGTNRLSGLTYFEMVIGATLSGSARVGICSQSSVFTGLMGADANSCGYDSGGTVKINNTTITTIMTYTINDRIGVAVDLVKQLIWFRKNNGNWNNDVIGNQNPVGGVGGISLATMTNNSISPVWGGSATSSATAKFATASWVDTAPTGFATVDTLAADGKGVTTNSPGRGGALVSPGTKTAATCKPNSQFRFPVFQPGNFNMTGVVGGTIAGQVQENGVPVAGKIVVVYDPLTRLPLNSAVSDGSGNYSIDCAGRPQVYAAAFDPTTYDALIFDQIVPG